MSINSDKLANLMRELLLQLGEDAHREGLKETPMRAARAYVEMLQGYERSLEEEITIFKNVHNYDDLIFSGGIDFYSTCEHHLLPFFGKAYIAYIPDKSIVGLSKLPRAVDIFSRRLQDQERITVQIADELVKLLKPQGLAVLLDGKHLCNAARGVKQSGSTMRTMTFRGIFKENATLCDRFISMTR